MAYGLNVKIMGFILMFNKIKKWLGGTDIYLVQINYKSGNNIKMWFHEFEYVASNGEVEETKWKVSNEFSRPLFMNISEIESVYQIKHKVAFV